MKRYRQARLLSAVLVVAFVSALDLRAVTIIVTNTNDSGPGSLRDAIALAADGDQITFNQTLSGTPITLTTAEVAINKSLEIVGLGVDRTVIVAGGTDPYSFRVFSIAPDVSVSISGATITAARSSRGGINNQGHLRLMDALVAGFDWSLEAGAGIRNSGEITLLRTTVRGNLGERGGAGLQNDTGGKAYLQECIFDGNWTNRGVTVFGNNGIANSGMMTIVDSVIRNNLGWGYGTGTGIGNGGSLEIVGSMITGNHVTGPVGGIANGGKLVVRESVISGNSSVWSTGGLENAGEAVLVNSTVYGNFSEHGDGAITNSGRLVLISSTVTANSHFYHFYGVGGISNNDRVGASAVRNSVIIGNYALFDCPGGDPLCYEDCNGSFVSQGHNIIGAANEYCRGFIDGNEGDIVGVAVEEILETLSKLWPRAVLADNGGPTPTVALLPDSPAIDRIPVEACTDEIGSLLATDQRGVPRPQGPACDVGAFELAIPEDVTFWAQQCREKGSREYTGDELRELLSQVKAKYASAAECVPVDCDLLTQGQPAGSLQAQAAQELLASWLNLASGKLTMGRPISLGRLTEAKTAEHALSEIEAVVCAPQASRDELLHARDIARALNNEKEK